MPALDDRRGKMLDLARRWRESGMKARAFAQEQGVTPWVLYYWRQRLAGQDRPVRRRQSRRVRLARVRVVSDVTNEAGSSNGYNEADDLEIVLISGDRIRIPAGASVETLRRVLQVLRGGC
jgi:hypothetical protein